MVLHSSCLRQLATTASQRGRPLAGIRVVEFGGLSPGPYAGMILADFGASVTRIDRAGVTFNRDQLARHKRSISLNAKSPEGLKVLRQLISGADVIIDPFRPGVLEKLAVGPQDCHELTGGRVIFARLTGYRRSGPYAKLAGHDINYIALSGVLSTIRPPGLPPIPPNNYLGDFAGGGLTCALGIMMALFERSVSGFGQVVEADMVTGTRYIASGPLMRGRASAGLGVGWSGLPGHNILDGGCPFYRVFECSDNKFIAVGALEPQFYKEFLETLALTSTGNETDEPLPVAATQHDRSTWPSLTRYFEGTFKTKTRDEWALAFSGGDSCVSPVLEVNEVGPHGEGLADVDGIPDWADEGGIPEPAPRLSETPARHASDWYRTRPTREGYFTAPGKDTEQILAELGYTNAEVTELLALGAVQKSS